MTNFVDVGLFHRKFGLHASDIIPGPETAHRLTDVRTLDFRRKFLQEELDEFEEAYLALDDAKAFDALIDLVYVAMGTAHLLGYPWEEGWAAVQRANMQKVRAESSDDARSVRRHELDVVKPEGWEPPDIRKVLKECRFEV